MENKMMNVESRYFDSSYLKSNPTWDREDAPWKAQQVLSILIANKLNPTSVCEVGCGSGDVLVNIIREIPSIRMTGYDISPQATIFWKDDYQNTLISEEQKERLNFVLGDFHQENIDYYDVLLMLDVFEHVSDPFDFLEKTKNHANYFVFHVPLDLSVSTILRKNPLLHVRRKFGHLHFYTKDLALETIQESGYTILDWNYTGAYFTMPNRSWKTKLASIPRKILCILNKDFGVRVFGGETLIVLAKSS